LPAIRVRLLGGCRCCRCLCPVGLGILAAEAFHAAGGVYQALFAGIERVTNRADFHVNVALVGRTGLKTVPAGAQNLHCGVIGMNLFLRHLSGQTFPAISLHYCRGIWGSLAIEIRPWRGSWSIFASHIALFKNHPARRLQISGGMVEAKVPPDGGVTADAVRYDPARAFRAAGHMPRRFRHRAKPVILEITSTRFTGSREEIAAKEDTSGRYHQIEDTQERKKLKRAAARRPLPRRSGPNRADRRRKK